MQSLRATVLAAVLGATFAFGSACGKAPTPAPAPAPTPTPTPTPAPTPTPTPDAAAAPTPDAAAAPTPDAAAAPVEVAPPKVPPATTADALRQALHAAEFQGETAKLLGRPGMIVIEIQNNGSFAARCEDGPHVNPDNGKWSCNADLTRCSADQDSLLAVWYFREGPGGARFLDGEVIVWGDKRPMADDDELLGAMTRHEELCALHDKLATHDASLVTGAIDTVSALYPDAPDHRTRCGGEARALTRSIVAHPQSWSCDGLTCTPGSPGSDSRIELRATVEPGGALRLASVALVAISNEPDDAWDKRLAIALSAPLGSCPPETAPEAPSVWPALEAYMALRLAPSLSCFDGKRDVPAATVSEALQTPPIFTGSEVRVVRAAADEVLFAEFGAIERDGAPKLDVRDALVRLDADGSWKVTALSGPTGKTCFPEAAKLHKDPPWRAKTCFERAAAHWKAIHESCTDPLRLCQQAEGGVYSEYSGCLAP